MQRLVVVEGLPSSFRSELALGIARELKGVYFPLGGYYRDINRECSLLYLQDVLKIARLYPTDLVVADGWLWSLGVHEDWWIHELALHGQRAAPKAHRVFYVEEPRNKRLHELAGIHGWVQPKNVEEALKLLQQKEKEDKRCEA